MFRVLTLACAVLSVSAVVHSHPALAASNHKLPIAIGAVEVVKTPRQMGEVRIHNPAIADVSVQTRTSLTVIAKSLGVTELVILDRQGRVMSVFDVAVERDQRNQVSVIRFDGNSRGSISDLYCVTICIPFSSRGEDLAIEASLLNQSYAEREQQEEASRFSPGQTPVLGDDINAPRGLGQDNGQSLGAGRR